MTGKRLLQSMRWKNASIPEVEEWELEAAEASDEEVAPVLKWFENNKTSSMTKA